MPPRQTISVAMIARNEEANLARTLAALAWCDEICVIDSGSRDRTPEIATAHGARHIFHLDFRGIEHQKNIAIGHCTQEWILLLDADEVVTPALAAEIQRTLEAPRFDAYMIPRLNLFMRRWMRHGGLFPDPKLRLFRRGTAIVEENIGPHGTAQHAGPKGTLRHYFAHYGYPDFGDYIRHMNQYSTDVLPAYFAAHPHTSRASLYFHALANPIVSFVKGYVLKLGFLDGAAGLVFHLNHAAYVHWKYVKAWESQLPPATPHPE